MTAKPAGLTARDVFTKFLRVPARGTRELVPLTLYPAFAAFLDAYDAIAAATGLPTCTTGSRSSP